MGHYTRLLAAGLAERGWHVGIASADVSPAARALCRASGVELHDLPGWALGQAPGAFRTLRSLDPDVVHFQYPTVGYGWGLGVNLLPSLLRWRAPGARIVVTFHEPFRLKGRIRNLPNLAAAHAVVRVNGGDIYPESLSLARRLARRKPGRVIPVPPNIPRSSLDATQRASLRRELLGDGEILLGSFGNVRPNKGLDVLPSVLQQLPTARLVLVSSPREDDACWAELRRQLRDAGVEERVTVTGYLSDPEVADVLASCDACVFPFREGLEPRNASFLAAAVQGTFTIATSAERHGYVAEENVHYVRAADPGDIVEAVRRRKERSARSAERWPDWSSVVRDHEVLYDRLLSPPRS